MPENKTIHDLPIAEQTNASDVFETEIPSQLMQSGYASRKVTMSSLETHMLGTEQYETQLPNFPQGSRSVFSALEYARQSGGGGASVIQKTLAEYNALPTADKMNGSIYKITDKALIYCLDEEYHAVKEITSADYALLSSAEKNNGTLYVITDEETTAADIPYSAGVSVADMLEVTTTPLDASSMSFDSGIELYTSASNYIQQIGNLIIISFGLKLTNATINSPMTIDNFVPNNLIPSFAVNAYGETGLGDGKYQSATLGNTGTLKIFPCNSGTTYCIGQFIYTI